MNKHYYDKEFDRFRGRIMFTSHLASELLVCVGSWFDPQLVENNRNSVNPHPRIDLLITVIP